MYICLWAGRWCRAPTGSGKDGLFTLHLLLGRRGSERTRVLVAAPSVASAHVAAATCWERPCQAVLPMGRLCLHQETAKPPSLPHEFPKGRVWLWNEMHPGILAPEHLQSDAELQDPGELQPPAAKLPAQLSAAHSCARGDLKKRGDSLCVSFYKPKIKTGLVNTCPTF